jgi:hypothetical protein
MTQLDDLLVFAKSEGRVCPQPPHWNKLYQLLPNTKTKGAGRDPANPLILAAWWDSSDEQKRERLSTHIHWAADQGALDTVAAFLRSLSKDQWHHEGE